MEEGQYKISGLEATILLSVCVFFDIIDIIATLLDSFFGVGEIIKILSNIIISPMLWFWTIIKGVKSDWVLIGGLLELIPIFGNTLPIRTATMIVLIYADWHPKAGQMIKITAKIKKR